ncbi:DUF5343 domain-containing protein [Acidobacterium sp. S8]|uniref:DUF5343 domain-containing protein n=1 Tax=Acidobacterium sp. S8 TaxID=1641854 RepID=UPI00131CF7DA|nr:DUF5343 domain-containing protein [Acidobacterium sp. S8]
MAEYPPYVNAYNGIAKLFEKIKAAAVPPKFTVDFMGSMLDLKSSSYRAMIPLLKRLGFIDQANAPTQAYKDYREDSLSGTIMAERLKEAYKPLFQANEYAWRLEKKELVSKLRSLTGAAEDDANIQYVASTFLELSKLANWTGTAPKPKREEQGAPVDGAGTGGQRREREELEGGLRLSYTINLNLPATTEIEVFNAIFKSLRENLLRQ